MEIRASHDIAKYQGFLAFSFAKLVYFLNYIKGRALFIYNGYNQCEADNFKCSKEKSL